MKRVGGIADLCIALAHRWEPGRIFVILTAYLDESGTHGGDGSLQNPASPTMVMAGMMGTAQQWARYAWEADCLRRRYGFRILHMKDLVKGVGEFSGWTGQQKVSLVEDFSLLTHQAKLMAGMTFRLNLADFEKEYIGPSRPKHYRLDSAYGLCFRNCVYHFALEAQRKLGNHKKWPETKLNFVLELGAKNKGDAERVFLEIKKDLVAVGCDLLGSFSALGKEDSVELMVADFLAFSAWRMSVMALNSGIPEHVHFSPMTRPTISTSKEAPASLTPNLVHVSHKPGAMPVVREEFAQREWARRRIKRETQIAKRKNG